MREFREWAWIGLLVTNSTSAELALVKEKIKVVTEPSLPKVRVFIYGPLGGLGLTSIWGEVNASAMREHMVSRDSPVPHREPKTSLLLGPDEKAVIWIYLENKCLDTVTVFVSIEIPGGDVESPLNH